MWKTYSKDIALSVIPVSPDIPGAEGIAKRRFYAPSIEYAAIIFDLGVF